LSVSSSSGDLVLEHNGGDRISAENLRVQVTTEDNGSSDEAGLFTDGIGVGDRVTADYDEDTNGGETVSVDVRIIHTPSDSIILDRTIDVNNVDTTDSDAFDDLDWNIQ